ncbi:Zinc finger protein 32 [Folsomia candida]|uniref:Zinc finger protein 32 n=1 Tax=Folsomia candida TaxID=158441 RepID=A0A226DB10_FOLCA|nr:Zinc finger protein 32 [Folsomia candida]
MSTFSCLLAHCKATLSSKIALQSHLKSVHIATRNFPCSICSNSFRNLRDVNVHIKKVHGAKKFKCSQCLKAFTMSCSLTAHVNHVHTTTRDFQCTICFGKYILTYGLHFIISPFLVCITYGGRHTCAASFYFSRKKLPSREGREGEGRRRKGRRRTGRRRKKKDGKEKEEEGREGEGRKRNGKDGEGRRRKDGNENLTLPHKNLTLTHKNITLPHKNITLPHKNLTLPQFVHKEASFSRRKGWKLPSREGREGEEAFLPGREGSFPSRKRREGEGRKDGILMFEKKEGK